MQSCTSGRAAFITGMYPLRVGLSVPMMPGMPASLRHGTPTLSKMLLSLGYNTGQFGKNHLGDKTESLPTAHGFQELWGDLYHLDAMSGVSFPDINKSHGAQVPGELREVPAAAVAAVLQPGRGDDPDPSAKTEDSNRRPPERMMS
jgi:arylsulfatase A-like enzyme